MTIIDARKWKVLKHSKFLFEVNEISWDTAGNYLFLTTGSGAIDIMKYVRWIVQGMVMSLFIVFIFIVASTRTCEAVAITYVQLLLYRI